MPANQDLRSALPMAGPDLLQTGVLQDPRASINKWRVGGHFYSSLPAELPQFGLTEVGVTLNLPAGRSSIFIFFLLKVVLNLIDGGNDGTFLNNFINLNAVKVG